VRTRDSIEVDGARQPGLMERKHWSYGDTAGAIRGAGLNSHRRVISDLADFMFRHLAERDSYFFLEPRVYSLKEMKK